MLPKSSSHSASPYISNSVKNSVTKKAYVLQWDLLRSEYRAFTPLCSIFVSTQGSSCGIYVRMEAFKGRISFSNLHCKSPGDSRIHDSGRIISASNHSSYGRLALSSEFPRVIIPRSAIHWVRSDR
jgi:hypothetical protein